MHVIRIENDARAEFVGGVEWVNVKGPFEFVDGEAWVPVSDVIELTEEKVVSHQDVEGFVGRPAHRFVSEWEPVDGD